MGTGKKEVSAHRPDLSWAEGKNLCQVLDVQAQRYPDRTWLVHGTERVTFGRFAQRTDNAAAALSRAGVRPGDFCALLFPNGIDYMLLQFAILKLGAILVPLNTRYRARELRFMLAFSGARFLFGVKNYLKTDLSRILAEVRPDVPALDNVYLEGVELPEFARPMHDIFGYEADPAERAAVAAYIAPDTVAATLLFTSGTTAEPKGVLLSHRARVWSGMRIAERMRITDDDVLLNPLPFCHEFGGFTIMSHALLCGCPMVVMDLFNAGAALELIGREKVSVIYGVPTMFSSMLNAPDLGKHPLSSLRTGYMSGAPCPLELVKAVQATMGCNISVAYGASEAPSHTISEYDDPPEVKASTVGKPIRDARVRIVDEQRREVPVGTAGEIALQGLECHERVFQASRPDRGPVGRGRLLLYGRPGPRERRRVSLLRRPHLGYDHLRRV